MVLQAGKEIPVWGWAEPGETVQVEFAGQTKTVAADSSKHWKVTLDSVPASSKPWKLVIRSSDGSQALVIEDVLIGEVWLCSGQSNMALTLKQTEGAADEMAAADFPQIRLFLCQGAPALTPQEDCKGRWMVCSSRTSGRFSAVAYYFGSELHQKLGSPVGLIQSALGGSPIESWISAEAQQSSPELKPFLELVERNVVGQGNAGNISYEKRLPAYLFNAQIAPLIPYAIRGCIWYQGEANTEPWKARFYKDQLPLLIQDWRTRRGDEFPFAWVQLPNYEAGGKDWPMVRDAMRVSLKVPKTGMVVTLDLGEPDNLHPKRKKEVGQRLSFWALHDVYGKADVVPSGPMVSSWTVQGSDVVVSFRHADGGLVAQGGELNGFEIRAEGHEWRPAVALISGSDVIVSNSEISAPVAVRYAWANNPPCTLFNVAGLPASPFCSEAF